NTTGKVEVHIQIEEGFTLRKGDRATIIRGLLSGDVSISFVPPSDQQIDVTPVEPDAYLVGFTPPDVGVLVQKGAEVVPNAQDAPNEIKKAAPEITRVFQRIDKDLPEITRVFQRLDKELIPDLRKTNDEIQVTVRNWGRLGERADNLLQANEDKLVKTLDRVQ